MYRASSPDVRESQNNNMGIAFNPKIRTSYGIIALQYRRPFTGCVLPHKLPKCDICFKKTPIVLKHPKHVKSDEWGDEWSVLLVQRRDTMAYCDIIRKAPNTDTHLWDIYFEELTCAEREKLSSLKVLPARLQKKMNDTTPSHFAFSEFGLPKGKKERKETNYECATREFSEETGYSLQLVRSLITRGSVVEQFVGTNGVLYRHVYYIMLWNSNYGNPTFCHRNPHQAPEIRNIMWCPISQLTQIFRPYDTEKHKVVEKALNVVKNSYHQPWNNTIPSIQYRPYLNRSILPSFFCAPSLQYAT